ncbi:MAG: histidinol dehydrogenase [Bacteroidota bacterium]
MSGLLPIVPYAERRQRLSAVLDRRAVFDDAVEASVRAILDDVRQRGDAALLDFTERFDGVRPERLSVPMDRMERALDALDPGLRVTLEQAAANVRAFHEAEMPSSWLREDGDGVLIGQRISPVERAGLYVPAGTAPLPSSVIMNAVPAQVAGVDEIHVCSPPGPDGSPHPLILATCRLLGIEHVYAVGGAQAIGALAFGTESVPRVDVIVGPGNAYVATAKKLVVGQVGIDSVAGPSEVLVLADDSADPTYAAADLLAQAEHDARASAVLVTPSAPLAQAVQHEVDRLIPTLPRAEVLRQSIPAYGAAIVTDSMADAIACVDELAPEHLVILSDDAEALWDQIRHAGAVFLGHQTPEPVGDYFAGPNHVLPTGGTARFASALGVGVFLRRQSVLRYAERRMRQTGESIARFAEAEQLDAHALAVRLRLAPAEPNAVSPAATASGRANLTA